MSSSRWAPVPGFTPRAEDALAHLLARTPAIPLLIGSGLATAAIYALLVLAFPLLRWWNQPHVGKDPNAINSMGAIAHYSPWAAIAFVLAICALFWFQFLALNAISRRTATSSPWLARMSIVFPVAFAAILVWMQPVTTTDLYGYIARGYLYTQLHFNPMTQPAFLLPGHLLVSRPPAPYGPAWLLLCGAFSALSGESLLLNMVLFKLVGAASMIISMWLIYALARHFDPSTATRNVMYFAWNPLVLFESVGNGHNDIVMMMFVLIALLLMVHHYARTAFAFLVLGALIKYMAVILIPLWLVYEIGQLRRHFIERDVKPAFAAAPGQHGRRASGRPAGGSKTTARRPAADTSSLTLTQARAVLAGQARATLHALTEVDRRAAFELIAGAAAIGALLVAGFFFPFWDGFKTFSGIGQQVRPLYYNASIVQFIAAPLELLVPPSKYEALDKTVRLVFYAIFAAYAWIQTQRLWMAGTRATLRDLVTAGAKVTFAALILIAFWLQPWYVIWLIPLAALSDYPFIRSRAAILSGGSLLTYAASNFLFVHDPGIGQALFVQFSEVMVTFLPLLLLRPAQEGFGWSAIAREYLRLFGDALRRRSATWDHIMLALILIVAAILRLVRLGNLFGTVSPTSPGGQALSQLSGDIGLILADPRGLSGPFELLQRGLIAVFHLSPFAILFPSALIGSLTVWLIYLVTTAIFSDGMPARARAIGLLAALLAATSQWHVSLSRSGMEVLTLPLLMCLALYLLLLALRLPAPQRQPVPSQSRRRGRRRGRPSRPTSTPVTDALRRRRLLLFAGSGAAAGLASDLAPGLWILPLLVLGTLVVVRWQRPKWYFRGRSGFAALAFALVIAALPGVWNYYLSGRLGVAGGLATGPSASIAHAPASLGGSLLAFVAQFARNAGEVLHVLTSQDYSVGVPSSGGLPILPGIIAPFFYVGLAIVLWRWRRFSSMTLLLLMALPLVASVAVGTQPNVIEAASVLPATCIVPALAIFELGAWLARLPIALDRAHGARVFANPESIGRMLFMAFLLFSALRTFFWYFQATLPSTPPNSTIAS
ncbi:MAG TPA: glycosyltransferase family 39 protein [Ktedonobacterales bacterium]